MDEHGFGWRISDDNSAWSPVRALEVIRTVVDLNRGYVFLLMSYKFKIQHLRGRALIIIMGRVSGTCVFPR